jgi:hypothetical protein
MHPMTGMPFSSNFPLQKLTTQGAHRAGAAFKRSEYLAYTNQPDAILLGRILPTDNLNAFECEHKPIGLPHALALIRGPPGRYRSIPSRAVTPCW